MPVYLLLDTSGSMIGEPVEAVKVGLQTMLDLLRQEESNLETVWLSIITFDTHVKQICPLTSLEKFILPPLNIPQSGATFLGQALEVLCECYDKELNLNSSDDRIDWQPLLFILTDGSPSDIGFYRETLPRVKMRNFGNIVACAAGPKAKESFLKELTDVVVSLDTMDSNSLKMYFIKVTETINVGNRSIDSVIDSTIPPPPPIINIVF